MKVPFDKFVNFCPTNKRIYQVLVDKKTLQYRKFMLDRKILRGNDDLDILGSLQETWHELIR